MHACVHLTWKGLVCFLQFLHIPLARDRLSYRQQTYHKTDLGIGWLFHQLFHAAGRSLGSDKVHISEKLDIACGTGEECRKGAGTSRTAGYTIHCKYTANNTLHSYSTNFLHKLRYSD